MQKSTTDSPTWGSYQRYRRLTGSDGDAGGADGRQRRRCCWFSSDVSDLKKFASKRANRFLRTTGRSARRTKGAHMSTAAERAAQLDLVARLKSAYPELPDAPTPDML